MRAAIVAALVAVSVLYYVSYEIERFVDDVRGE